jgi:hypothetical protein
MKSDIIKIDNMENGFRDALLQTTKSAQFRDLTHRQTLQLRLCAEEMLSLARSVTGEMQATFWVESEGKQFDLHLSTKTVMDKEKRENLIASATSRKNEAASTFLGKLRDAFEQAMAMEVDYSIPDDALDDLANHPIVVPEWDEFEQSILREVADQVKISVIGDMVDMTITKSYV